MPIYVYPQGPTAAVTRLKRIDEAASANEPTKLDSEQQVAIIGETIPLIFCKRTEDAKGGVWAQPRLIAIGLQSNVFSLLYVLTQGRIDDVPIADAKYGQTALSEIESNTKCVAYQQIPDCVDIDQQPGGDIGWTDTVTSTGPSLTINTGQPDAQGNLQIHRWTSTTDRCTGIAFTFQGAITVSGSGSYIQENFVNLQTLRDHNTSGTGTGEILVQGGQYSLWPNCTFNTLGNYQTADYDQIVPGRDGYPWFVSGSWPAMPDLEQLTGGEIQRLGQPWTDKEYYGGKWYSTTSVLSRNISWTAFSERTWTYRVINVDGEVVYTSSVTIRGNNETEVISNLAPSKYTVEFYETSAQRNTAPSNWTRQYSEQQSPYSIKINLSSVLNSVERVIRDSVAHQNSIRSSYHNQFRADVAGSESVNIQATQVVEQVFTEIDGPDDGTPLPPANFRDLTLIGIKGGTSALRPTLGPDYFLQLHCFIRDGIQVRQQLQGLALGPSNSYSDLVLHLMERSSMLQSEQIDYPAMLTAARFCEAYKMRFNGILRETNSLAEWMTRTAPYFLLNPRQVDGKHGLAPVVPTGADNKVSLEAVVPVITLTTEDLVDYQRSYLNVADRKPTCMVMMFRQQSETGPGQPRTIEVRYPGTAQDGPFQTHDMTDMVTDINHASIVARYILAKRRYVTHTVSCSIGRHGSFLFPGQIVQIDLDLETTDGEGVTDSKLYEIEEIVEGVNGQVQLELLEFPVDDEGISLIAKDIENGTVEVT